MVLFAQEVNEDFCINYTGSKSRFTGSRHYETVNIKQGLKIRIHVRGGLPSICRSLNMLTYKIVTYGRVPGLKENVLKYYVSLVYMYMYSGKQMPTRTLKCVIVLKLLCPYSSGKYI